MQKTAREKVKKVRREEASSRRAFLYFLARCFLRCTLLTERLEEATFLVSPRQNFLKTTLKTTEHNT